MADPKAAARSTALQMMIAECEGQAYEGRRHFAVLIPTLRGHKITAEGIREGVFGLIGQCSNCEQVVKVKPEGTNVEGRAVENDCPAAEWRRP